MGLPNKIRTNSFNIRSLKFACQQTSLVWWLVMDFKTAGPGSIPDGVTNVFSLIRCLLKTLKRLSARTFYLSKDKGSI